MDEQRKMQERSAYLKHYSEPNLKEQLTDATVRAALVDLTAAIDRLTQELEARRIGSADDES